MNNKVKLEVEFNNIKTIINSISIQQLNSHLKLLADVRVHPNTKISLNDIPFYLDFDKNSKAFFLSFQHQKDYFDQSTKIIIFYHVDRIKNNFYLRSVEMNINS